MRRSIAAAFACAALLIALAGPAAAGVNINVGIGIPIPVPVVVAPAPPPVVVVPGTPLYYAPGMNVDVFFYGGWWWTPYQGYWFRGPAYNGPWAYVQAPPRVFFSLPPDYRQRVIYQRPIPYGYFQQHWREWDRDRRGPSWDGGGWKEHENHGWGDRDFRDRDSHGRDFRGRDSHDRHDHGR
jgi:hypothetical protein